MSDFAKNQLLKFGWTEGKGLGKNENGITQAIKPKLKFDTSGIGHKNQDDQCWSSIFNKAASNIVVDKSSDEVSISVLNENARKVLHEKFLERSTFYHGNFIKRSTLLDGNLVQDSTCQVPKEKEEEKAKDVSFTIMTDEELFKACGGRTAHKGARHGLTLSGKLTRVAEQEKQLNAGLKSCKKSLQSQEREKKRKKHIEEDDIPPLDIEDDDLILPTPIYKDESYRPSKKTAKKNKRKIQDLVQQLSNTCLIQDDHIKEDKEGDITMEPNSKKLKKTAKSILKSNSCDTADPTHMCEKCEFYDYHQKSFEKYKKMSAGRKKKFKKKVSFVEDKEQDFCMTAKEYKRKGKKKLGLKSTAKEAVKLNGRIEKRKNKKQQRKEKQKRNFILPAKLQIDDTTVKFTGIKIGD